MKKLLLLAGILVVASSVFGAATTEVSGDVDIYAQVVNDLKIETEPLNFGAIGIQDAKEVGHNDNDAGEFIITGAINANISLEISDLNSQTKYTDGSIVAKLEREGGDSATDNNDILNPIIYVYDEEGNRFMGESFTTSSGASSLAKSKTFKVGGRAETSASQNTGNYKGAITVTARYDAWAGPID